MRHKKNQDQRKNVKGKNLKDIEKKQRTGGERSNVKLEDDQMRRKVGEKNQEQGSETWRKQENLGGRQDINKEEKELGREKRKGDQFLDENEEPGIERGKR